MSDTKNISGNHLSEGAYHNAPDDFASGRSLSAALFPRRHSSIRRTVRFTPEGLDSLLHDYPPHPILPGTGADTYPSPDMDITGAGNGYGAHLKPGSNGELHDADTADEGHELDDVSRFVGRDLTNKQPPVHPLDQEGPNPSGQRQFLGAEFPGMFTFDPDGKPTFLSRFPEAESIGDIKEIRLNIASKLPDYMTGQTPQAVEIEAMEEEAFGGRPLNDAFVPVDGTLLRQVERYAKDFEDAFGIKITYGVDLPDSHISLMGYNSPNQNLLGFASFPPSINQWPSMTGLGAHPGYMLLNRQYTSEADGKGCYDLFAHEFGHALGMAHPHDLAILQMDKREALTATKMAYTDLVLRGFQHLVTDGKGNPILKDGKPQYHSEGLEEGALDFGLRKWVANPPVMGHVTDPDPNSPRCDLYKNHFDLKVHHEQALNDNAKSYVFRTEKLMPIVPMINDGRHAVLSGTEGNDLLDTNPGYTSVVTNPALGIEQKFYLVEGHFEKVLGISGNNTIIASQSGDQEIHPGKGSSELDFVYPDFSGKKRIIGESGKDTLVLTDDVMKHNNFRAKAAKDGRILLEGTNGSISIEGKGIQSILIIDRHGSQLSTFPANGLNAADLNREIFDNQAWQSPPAPAEKAANDTNLPHTASKATAAHNSSPVPGTWADKVQAPPENIRGIRR